MSRHFKAEIIENLRINEACSLLSFLPLSKTREPQPGQFYMFGLSSSDPLLKRPFSLFRKTERGLHILYRIKGKGTALLREMRVGSQLDVIGPLGNYFPIPAVRQTPVIMAGGIGIASVFYLAEKLAEAGRRPHLFYGVREEGELLFMNEVQGLAERTYISTDDGSCGEKGCITDMARNFFSGLPVTNKDYVIYSCGPRPMLEALHWITKDRNIPAYVSMEERMACGIGACLGCVVKTTAGYKRVCKEGPVFDIRDIVW